MKRIQSIDIVRGLVMLVMAIDHTRDLIHHDSLTHDPTNLATTSPGLFLTRLITHFCAPIFVFLAGSSSYLGLKSKGPAETRTFLITRGLFLILLEFTVIGFGIWWDISFRSYIFQVIAAIGVGMILLGLFLSLGYKMIGLAGLAIIVLHNLYPLLPIGDSGILRQALNAVLIPSFKTLPGGINFIMSYPVIPWLGVLWLGYGFGHFFEVTLPKRQHLFFRAGAICIGLFVLLRSGNFYGDPASWHKQESMIYSFMSFLNVTKYPPSLQFCLLTLGVMFFLLILAEKIGDSLQRFFETYGRVPLFYYIAHWYVLHPAMFIVLYFQGFSWKDFRFGMNFGRPEAPHGLGLWGVYGIWLGAIILLYPLCRWYGNYKKAHPEKKWLRYL